MNDVDLFFTKWPKSLENIISEMSNDESMINHEGVTRFLWMT